jgi:hypothetical protein
VIHRSAGRIGDANQLIGAIVGIHEGLRHPAHRDGRGSEVPAGIVSVSGRTGSIPPLAEPTDAVRAAIMGQGHIQALVRIVDGRESVQGIVGMWTVTSRASVRLVRLPAASLGIGRGPAIGTHLLHLIVQAVVGVAGRQPARSGHRGRVVPGIVGEGGPMASRIGKGPSAAAEPAAIGKVAAVADSPVGSVYRSGFASA